MSVQKFPSDFFEHNGFKQIDDTIINGGQSLAEQSFASAPFKASKKNCVLVYKQNDKLYSQLKRDYDSSIRQSAKLLEKGINSIIFIFSNYPNTVKHHIVADNPNSISNYEGKGRTFIKDIDISERFNPSNN